jgi:nucleotide-binding universal stress UspA family protein
LLLIGREPASVGNSFTAQITETIAGFPGAFAIAIARGQHLYDGAAPPNILVTVSGTRASRQGAELAVALAHAAQGSLSALHVDSSEDRIPFWRPRFGTSVPPRSSASAAIGEIVELGEHQGVEVRGRIRKGGSLRNALLHELAAGKHDLLVMGVSARPGEQLFLGDLAAQMLERAKCSLLFVCAEGPPNSQVAR